MTRPAIGSASGKPRPARPMPTTAPSDTRASTREWTPSASRALEPIPRPTRTLYSDTARLATMPIAAAATLNATLPYIVESIRKLIVPTTYGNVAFSVAVRRRDDQLADRLERR